MDELEKMRARTKSRYAKNIENNKNLIIISGTKKKCSYCQIEKDVTEFGRHRGMKDGLRIYCKECTNAFFQTYVKADPTRRKEILKRSFQKSKTNEEFIARNRARRQTPKSIFSIYKDAAYVRKLSFDLTLDLFVDWHGKTDCFYCSLHISTIGIDRIDSDKGYTIDNIVPCCKVCNKMKMDLSVAEFKKQIKLIFNNICKEN
jgi:hypothetical protein